jgi:hypothetical protein
MLPYAPGTLPQSPGPWPALGQMGLGRTKGGLGLVAWSLAYQPWSPVASLSHKAWLTSSNLRHQVLALLLIASLASQGFDANLRCAVAAKLWRPSLRGLGRPSLVGYRTAQPWSRRPSPPLVELRRRASLTKPSQAKPYCTLVLPSPIRPSAAKCTTEHTMC